MGRATAPGRTAAKGGLRIAAWNVNSVKARLPNLLDWLDSFTPEVALLQEIKCPAEDFPRLEIEDRGYNLAVAGQKSYNGVAILSKTPLEVARDRLPGDEGDDQARYLEAVTGSGRTVVRVASLYLPNGNPVGSDKFAYKLAWMDRLLAHARTLLALDEAVVLGGDYNIAPADGDVYDPEGWRDDALCRPESRGRFRALLHLGYVDAWRARHAEVGAFTYWDYQQGRWNRDEGLRIDHLLLNAYAADRLGGCEIDRGPRGKPKASDHTPVWCELGDAGW
ncbi:MAG: exodeoxyribonuclease III [Proteobacteria bacterium]|nr:exodeoxyribonuclease III [Pseudomonadota bacterium]